MHFKPQNMTEAAKVLYKSVSGHMFDTPGLSGDIK